jgi:predicted deacylase
MLTEHRDTALDLHPTAVDLIHLHRWTDIQRVARRLIFKRFVANDPKSNKNLSLEDGT